MLRIASLVALVAVALSLPCRRPCQMLDEPRPCAPCRMMDPPTTPTPCLPATTTQAPCRMMDPTTAAPCAPTPPPCRMMDPPTTPAPCPTRPPCMMDPPTTPSPCLPTQPPCRMMDPTTPAPCYPTTTEAPCLMDAPTAPPCQPTQPPCRMMDPVTAAPCYPTTTTEAPCFMMDPIIQAPCPMLDPCAPIDPCSYDQPAALPPCGYGYDAQPQKPEFNECQDGWTRYQESCYYVERQETKSLDQAEKSCLQMDATLFVADSLNEFETIIDRAPHNAWTWLGLVKASEEDAPRWHTNASISYKDLPWLIKPYGDASNGWTSASKCAAHWNPSSSIGKYNYYYPCSYSFYFVCEKNSTLVAAANSLHF